MKQNEIDEISEAFKEAWTEYFGDEIYYVPFDTVNNIPDSVYKEKIGKRYDYDNKKLFHGTLKEIASKDETHATGKKVYKDYEVTFVTKELIDQGVTEIDTRAILYYVDRFNKEHEYKIYDEYQKVQLSDNKVFTKLKVVPI
jgi:hypothetical protein